MIWMMIACCGLPSIIVLPLHWPNAIHEIHNWLEFLSYDDSWAPIANAMHYVDTHANAMGLYKETYFRSSHQFIYSPLSLSIFIQLRNFLGINFGNTQLINIFSWFILPILAITAFFGFKTLLAQNGPIARGGISQIPLMIASILSVFIFYPITMCFSVGNIQNWLTALMAMSLIAWMSGRGGLAGVLLGLATLVKPHMGVIMLWALLRRDWRFCIGMCIVLAVALLNSVIMFGLSVHWEYLDLLRYLSSRGESFFDNHSFEGNFYRMIHDGNNLIWDGAHRQLHYVPWVHHLASVLSAIVLIIAMIPRQAAKGAIPRFLDYSIILISTVAASPVAYSHHYGIVYLIAPGAALVLFSNSENRRGLLALLFVGYALVGGVFRIVDFTADTALNFLQSYRLYGALCLLWALYSLRELYRTRSERQVKDAVVTPPASRLVAA